MAATTASHYRTSRGRHSKVTHRIPAFRLEAILDYDAFERSAMISPRALLMIAGTEAESRYFSQAGVEAAGAPKTYRGRNPRGSLRQARVRRAHRRQAERLLYRISRLT